MSRVTPSPAVRVALVSLFVLLGLLAVPLSPASAHVERPAYWPDPGRTRRSRRRRRQGAEGAVAGVAAGRKRRRGETRVVCQRDSMRQLKASVARASSGYDIRPSDHRTLSAKKARSAAAHQRAAAQEVRSSGRSSRL